jgi:metallophosphoesterase superfamily enzyme
MVGMIKEGRADCLIINGDIGYELNSNVKFHELTMGMIEEVASLVPVILNRGNHEENRPDNTVGSMFEDYF